MRSIFCYFLSLLDCIANGRIREATESLSLDSGHDVPWPESRSVGHIRPKTVFHRATRCVFTADSYR